MLLLVHDTAKCLLAFEIAVIMKDLCCVLFNTIDAEDVLTWGKWQFITFTRGFEKKSFLLFYWRILLLFLISSFSHFARAFNEKQIFTHTQTQFHEYIHTYRPQIQQTHISLYISSSIKTDSFSTAHECGKRLTSVTYLKWIFLLARTSNRDSVVWHYYSTHSLSL